MSKWTAMTLACAGLAIAVSARAADVEAPPAAATCAACHGARGAGGGGGAFPRLAGQPAAYLARQLHDFKSGARDSRIMQPLAAGLSNEQIGALATYYSEVEAPYPDRATVEPAVLRRGEALVRQGQWSAGVPACASCHGPKLAGLPPDFPALAGQYAIYIASQLEAWQQGRRTNDPLDLMQQVAHGLNDEDVKAVSAYLAWLRPGGDNSVPPSDDTATASEESRLAAAPTGKGGFQPPPESAIPAGPDGE
ncbi:MAG TPA: c-type cytochrome, partial [Gammaproteobacteria bacterium]|nr:c-type cytochrome [Gammaproteobacteria bacterium]